MEHPLNTPYSDFRASTLRIVMAQLNLLVGDVTGNTEKVIAAAAKARDELKADAVVFPELTLVGYPPEDLLLRPGLQGRVERGLGEIRRRVRGIEVIVGHPHYRDGRRYNAASVIRDGAIRATYCKHDLPNYSVFDEKRYFTAGTEPCVVDIKGVPVGLTICEDIWTSGPVRAAAQAGARLLLNLNASPFHAGKGAEREEVMRARVRETGLPLAYVNLLGGQDELVFDGESLAMDAEGRLVLRAPAFDEGVFPLDIEWDGEAARPVPGVLAPSLPLVESVYRAIVLGVRDYIEKNRFAGAVIGLSGGLDSALVLAIAVDAIGAGRVEAVMMPSRYTSTMSLEDAVAEAEVLGVRHSVISIEPAFQAFLASLAEEFAGLPPDTTEENIQARCRGVLLMAISNKKRMIVLTTGNKSETAVGYTTLYGDMAGGFAPIKDVPKTLAYRLAEYRNGISPVIPRRVLERAPSAELAPGQKDEDTLPPYSVLDPILEMYVERDLCVEDIVAAGYDEATVRRVAAMVDRNEYKRRQAPPGVKISRRAFGRDRRYPITSGFGSG